MTLMVDGLHQMLPLPNIVRLEPMLSNLHLLESFITLSVDIGSLRPQR